MKLSDITIDIPVKKYGLRSSVGEKVQIPSIKNVLNLFKEQVVLYPGKVAVSDGSESITYLDLDEKSDNYARNLIKLGVKEEEVVALMVDRSIEFVVLMLAVLKAGGAYLPLSSNLPVDRLNYMISNASSKVLVYDKSSEILQNQLYVPNLTSVSLTEINIKCDHDYRFPKRSLNSLMYIIYTSGTTGQPKGVMVNELGVVSLVCFSSQVQTKSDDVILQTVDFSFDPSVMEIFSSLLNGASLYIISKSDLLNLTQIERLILEEKITWLTLITPIFEKFIDENISIFKPLKTVLFGGEKSNYEKVKRFKKTFPNINLVNCYGPTECTIVATCNLYDMEQSKDSIGKTITNISAFVIDRDGNIVSDGSEGELCVSGVGVARGYISDETYTNKKFVRHPLNKNQTMYKTGDLVRMDSEGYIDFLGRIDDQIKFNGYRIELGEVTTKLEDINGVLSASTQFFNERLCSFLTVKDIDEDRIRREISLTLPDYMIPTHFIIMEDFPLTQNGKINIPELKKIYKNTQNLNLKPNQQITEIEEKILTMWKSVLKIEDIHPTDDFFSLGGTSLDLVTLHSKIQEYYPGLIEANDLFSLNTVKSISQHIENNLQNDE